MKMKTTYKKRSTGIVIYVFRVEVFAVHESIHANEKVALDSFNERASLIEHVGQISIHC